MTTRGPAYRGTGGRGDPEGVDTKGDGFWESRRKGEGSDNGDRDEDDDDDEEEDDEDEEEEDDEPPPQLDSSSASEGEPSTAPKTKGPPATRKKKAAAAGTAGGGMGGGHDGYSANGGGDGGGKGTKPAAAAASAHVRRGGPAGGVPEPPLWTAFAKSRKGDDYDLLGVVPLKKWESFEKDSSIPLGMRSWYSHQVLGNRSVPQALLVPRLPSGFPEFCHWVADGCHRSSGGTLKAGFEPMAVQLVKQVKAAERGVRAPVASTTRGAVAAAAEPIGGGAGGGGGVDPRARKRERRTRKGGTVANGAMFAEKMQSAIAGLEVEGIEEDVGVGGGDRSAAAARAARAGARAEAEVHNVLLDEVVDDETIDAGDVLGPAFADSKLPQGTLVMLGSLKRARAYRRRCDRQSAFLENELERCLGRLARVEVQYRSLVAETSGRECTLAAAIARAGPLSSRAAAYMEEGAPVRALECYDDVIKLLEVHVDQSPGEGEDSEAQQARRLLGLALCNRSLANLTLGNAFCGKRDAQQAEAVWPSPESRDHLKRSIDLHREMSSAAPAWLAFSIPP